MSRKIGRRGLMVAAMAAGLGADWARAASSNWTFNGNGSWTVASNWQGGVPVAGSDVSIVHNDAINRTITYNYTGGSIQLNSMTVENFGSGTDLFSQSANTFNSLTETIGEFGTGYWKLGGGTHNVNGPSGLTFGNHAGSAGIGTMTAGALNVAVFEQFANDAAFATFTHSGGTNTIGSTSSAASLGIGVARGSTADYLLSGSGVVNVFGSEFVSMNGHGTFNQIGGANNVGTSSLAQSGSLYIGTFNDGVGTYLLSGSGSLNVYGNEFIAYEAAGVNGAAGAGTFNQAAGTHTVGTSTALGSLHVGYRGSGAYLLSGGSLTVFGDEYVGDQPFTGAAGTFNQTGGTHTIGSAAQAANFILGNKPTTSGTYTLTGGALNVFGNESVANDAGLATFTHSGGTHTIGTTSLPGILQIGAARGSAGTYALSGGGALNVLGSEYVAGTGVGTFIQTGGTHTLGVPTVGYSGSLYVGAFNDGLGTYLLSGSGLLNVNGREYIGYEGPTINGAGAVGTFLQSGGSHNVYELYVGSYTGARGTYTLTGGTLNAGTLFTSQQYGTFTLGGGTLSAGMIFNNGTFSGFGVVPQVAYLSNAGSIIASNGILNLSAATFQNSGTLSASPGATLFIITSSFTHTGDIATSSGSLVVNMPVTQLAGHGISMNGGLLAAPSITINSGGTFSGFGQVNGNVANSGSMTFIGASQIIGDLTNNSGGQILVKNDRLLVTGAGVNNGSITTANGSIIFNGGLSGAPGMLTAGASGGALASYIRQQMLSLSGTSSAPAGVAIRSRAVGGDVSVVHSLSFAGSTNDWFGALDLADTSMIVDYTGASPIATIANQIKSGYANSAWNGNGITSSSAQAASPSAHKTALGYLDNATAGLATFSGQPLDSTSILIGYVYSGDANLDGTVDTVDFNNLASNFAGSGKVWGQGDFNYDSSVDTIDFNLLASNFGQTLAGPALGQTVAEPAGLALLIICGAPLLRQRNSRKIKFA